MSFVQSPQITKARTKGQKDDLGRWKIRMDPLFCPGSSSKEITTVKCDSLHIFLNREIIYKKSLNQIVIFNLCYAKKDHFCIAHKCILIQYFLLSLNET